MTAPTSSPNPAEPAAAAKPLTRLRHEHIRGWVAFAISLPSTYALGHVLALTLPRPMAAPPVPVVGAALLGLMEHRDLDAAARGRHRPRGLTFVFNTVIIALMVSALTA